VTYRWLGLALYAEGPTDHHFLDELLRRAVEHLLLDSGHAVELSSVQRLPVSSGQSDRAARIASGAEAVQGAFHLLFVHADGAGDAARAKSERVQPGLDAVNARLGAAGRAGVAVIPVKETEAWALADSACLLEILGTKRSPTEVGLPESPREIEALADPKATFAAIVRAARPQRRGRRRPAPGPFLGLVGQQARISELGRLSAFDALLQDVDAALTSLGFRT